MSSWLFLFYRLYIFCIYPILSLLLPHLYNRHIFGMIVNTYLDRVGQVFELYLDLYILYIFERFDLLYHRNLRSFYISQFRRFSYNHCKLNWEWPKLQQALVWLFWDLIFSVLLLHQRNWKYHRIRLLLQVGLHFGHLPLHIRRKVVFFMDLLKHHKREWYVWIYQDRHLYRDVTWELFFWMLFWFIQQWLFFIHQEVRNIMLYWLISFKREIIISWTFLHQILRIHRSLQILLRTY